MTRRHFLQFLSNQKIFSTTVKERIIPMTHRLSHLRTFLLRQILLFISLVGIFQQRIVTFEDDDENHYNFTIVYSALMIPEKFVTEIKFTSKL